MIHWYKRWRARIDPREHFYWRMQRVILPLQHEFRTQGWIDAYAGDKRACAHRAERLARIEHQVERLKRRGWYGGSGGWSFFIPAI